MVNQCVILAAGRGSRLLLKDQSKSLHRICEESLLERHLRLFSRFGITHFWIVVGYLSDQIRQTLSQHISNSYTVNFIENIEWERGNGVSVLKAKKCVTSPFLLVMADHIFSEEAVSVFCSESNKRNKIVTLAVDVPGYHNRHIDLADVTKVKLSGLNIVKIGKNLTDYDVYDTGLFQCQSGLFNALENSIALGDESLSGGVSVLAQKEAVDTFNIAPHFWCDVDTPQDANSAQFFLRNEDKKSTNFVSSDNRY